MLKINDFSKLTVKVLFESMQLFFLHLNWISQVPYFSTFTGVSTGSFNFHGIRIFLIDFLLIEIPSTVSLYTDAVPILGSLFKFTIPRKRVT